MLNKKNIFLCAQWYTIKKLINFIAVDYLGECHVIFNLLDVLQMSLFSIELSAIVYSPSRGDAWLKLFLSPDSKMKFELSPNVLLKLYQKRPIIHSNALLSHIIINCQMKREKKRELKANLHFFNTQELSDG